MSGGTVLAFPPRGPIPSGPLPVPPPPAGTRIPVVFPTSRAVVTWTPTGRPSSQSGLASIRR